MNDAKNVLNRLQKCSGRDAMAREALSILLEATGAREGHLFCYAGGRLQCVASLGSSDEGRALQPALEALLKKEFGSDMITTALEGASLPPQTSGPLAGAEHLPLLSRRGGETLVAGVAVLRYGGGAPKAVQRRMTEALSNALIESKLTEALACVT